MTALIPATKADLADKRWLDQKIGEISDGMEAVIDIAQNWRDGRNLQRFAPMDSPAEYIRRQVGVLHLDRPAITLLLTETNLSQRQIAKVAGVSPATVTNVKNTPSTVQNQTVERPAEKTIGGDNKARTVKEKPAATTMNVPVIQGIAPPTPVAPSPSPAAREALALINAVANIDTQAVIQTMTVKQNQSLRKACQRARRVLDLLDVPLHILP